MEPECCMSFSLFACCYQQDIGFAFKHASGNDTGDDKVKSEAVDERCGNGDYPCPFRVQEYGQSKSQGGWNEQNGSNRHHCQRHDAAQTASIACRGASGAETTLHLPHACGEENGRHVAATQHNSNAGQTDGQQRQYIHRVMREERAENHQQNEFNHANESNCQILPHQNMSRLNGEKEERRQAIALHAQRIVRKDKDGEKDRQRRDKERRSIVISCASAKNWPDGKNEDVDERLEEKRLQLRVTPEVDKLFAGHRQGLLHAETTLC